jgi:hypothetical protein
MKKRERRQKECLTVPPAGGKVRQKDRPWIKLGISRATWYRLGKPATKPTKKPTQSQTAATLKIGTRTLQRAARVAREAPELLGLLRAGKLKLRVAEQIILDRQLQRVLEALAAEETKGAAS